MPDLFEYKCPCCGGSVAFDSTSQMLKCPYCDTEFDAKTLQSEDGQTLYNKPDEMHWGEEQEHWTEDGNMRIYVCNSCGGEVIMEETTAAAACPLCGNNIVVKGNLAGELRPDILIPFKLDKKAAKQGLMKHLQGKKLLPKVFKDEQHIDEIKGVYVPFWLFSAECDADVALNATKTRSWSDSRYNYTETSHYTLYRSGDLSFADVPVDGSSKMADALMESIEPFDLSQAEEFKSSYLSGYLAERYDVDDKQSKERANTRIRNTTLKTLQNQTCGGYGSVSVKTSSVRFRDNRVRYALYPVWLLNTSWNGKTYQFAMNGQTGKFVGDLPVDMGLYFKYLGIYSAAAALILYAVLTILQYL
ncbi:MAG: hypothetical protein MJ175_06080 [Clostridia bacterium]|nr:hypothetical protein [Clostridia bacterium]